MGEWELAIADFGEALRLNPENVEAHSARGVVYAKRAQFQEAITEFTEAIRLGPADGGLYHNRARAYKRLGEATASAADFSKAQELGYPPGVRSATTVLEPGVRFAFKASDDPTAKGTDQPDPGGAAMRERSMAKARAAGFTPLDPLPTAGHRAFVAGKLRPKEDIAGRLMALQAVVLWVTAAEADVSTAEVREFASRNRLETLMTPEERQIFNSSRPRAAERHRPTIGWRMENMWPLAWVLGFKWAPTTTHGQVSGDIMTPMFKGFLPRLSSSIADFAENVNLRRLEEVAQLEDEFYCTHNAVRSAQLGEKNRVPDGFDPINDGGVIHERRHSLSWVLSPGVPWDETDLST